MKITWISIYFIVLVWSAISPEDPFTWFLEVLPALIGFVILGLTYNRFRLTGLTYSLILIHCIILMIGGHYTYAKVPLFDWIQDVFELSRNNYDKVGHLAQGFIPAIIAREILIRKEVIKANGWLNFLIICFCLALSAFYELIEWWVAELTGESADAFLGTQGYMWDTQSDMALALFGSIIAIIILSKLHDSQLQELKLKQSIG
jgi:putative membrane protein